MRMNVLANVQSIVRNKTFFRYCYTLDFHIVQASGLLLVLVSLQIILEFLASINSTDIFNLHISNCCTFLGKQGKINCLLVHKRIMMFAISKNKWKKQILWKSIKITVDAK